MFGVVRRVIFVFCKQKEEKEEEVQQHFLIGWVIQCGWKFVGRPTSPQERWGVK